MGANVSRTVPLNEFVSNITRNNQYMQFPCWYAGIAHAIPQNVWGTWTRTFPYWNPGLAETIQQTWPSTSMQFPYLYAGRANTIQLNGRGMWPSTFPYCTLGLADAIQQAWPNTFPHWNPSLADAKQQAWPSTLPYWNPGLADAKQQAWPSTLMQFPYWYAAKADTLQQNGRGTWPSIITDIFENILGTDIFIPLIGDIINATARFIPGIFNPLTEIFRFTVSQE